MEKQLNRKEIYNGKVLKFVVDEVEINNIIANREIVFHNGGACMAIKDIDNNFIMAKQFRYVHNEELIEFVAGKIEFNEDPKLTAIREAKEEAGVVVKNIVYCGYIIPTCGYSSEKIYLYYGEVDKKVSQHFDADEYINLVKYSFEEIKEMINKGIITDAKTIALAYHIENKKLI